jgi:tetratricopeptide (TPR) repeat protein
LVAWQSGIARAESNEVGRYITAAAQLYESLEYERALEQLERAKNFPRTVENDVAIALYEGIILEELGRKDQALTAFKTGLLLRPEVGLPVRVSPKVKLDFEGVRAEVRKELAANEAQSQAQAAAAAKSDRPEREKRLLSESAPPPSRPSSSSVLFTRIQEKPLPIILLGTGAVAAGAATVFGLQSNSQVNAAMSSASLSDAQSHLAKANTDAKVANVLFAVSAAAVVGGVTTFFIQNGNPWASAPSDSPEQ